MRCASCWQFSDVQVSKSRITTVADAQFLRLCGWLPDVIFFITAQQNHSRTIACIRHRGSRPIPSLAPVTRIMRSLSKSVLAGNAWLLLNDVVCRAASDFKTLGLYA